jgi:primosomal protein N' (replication factor Y)
LYARVVVDTGATSSIDSLTYEIPDGLAGGLGVGSCVLVPLASRQAVGYVIGFSETSPVEKTRAIIAILDSPVRLTEEMFRLADWISTRYLSPLPRVVAGMLPGVMHCRVQGRVESSKLKVESSLTPAESDLMNRIAAEDGGVSVDSLGGDRATVQRLLRQLEKKGAVRRSWRLIAPGGKPRVMRGVRLASGAGGVGTKHLHVDVAISEKLPADAIVGAKHLHVDGADLNSPSANASPLQPLQPLPEKQAHALELIGSLGRDVSIAELTRRYGLTSSPIASLCKKGLLEEVDIVFRRDPAFARIEQKRVTLGEDQRRAVDEIVGAMESGSYRGHLLFGVTASGKTEVYLRCIDRALELGKTSLVLLPEIALTTQVMNIFKSRLGDAVAVLHSALSAGERCDEWARISEGEAKVVLGARSAVFAPLSNIGLVIVDEEHDGSYKQDISPRYNGRDVAIRRAEMSNAAVVLGSATPSIETFHLARDGVYTLLTMASRVENRPMPTVHIADLREEFARGKATIFSERLEQGIRDRIARGEQAILLQNRRAYSTFLLCRDCGFVARCPNCAVSLKFHSAARKLSCHHCGHEQPAPDVCPKCAGLRIRRFGIGTEKVEEETKNTFEGARVLRMDRDTTSRKGSHGEILSAFRAGDADILVGTQMIAKGLDFPNVTLVGVISADTSLNLPDFRAAERTFQLISQVAGRSGRGETPGEVVIQTLDPEHYAIKCAVDHDYVAFFDQELEFRRELGYPPFSTLVNVVSRDENDRDAMSALDDLAEEINKLPMAARKGVKIDGPIPAVLSKLKGQYRWHTVLRSEDREAVLGLLRAALEGNPGLRKKLAVDVDPMSML